MQVLKGLIKLFSSQFEKKKKLELKERVPRRMVYELDPGGRRSSGRPRLCWLQNVEMDLIKMADRQIRRAMDKVGWDRPPKKTKTLQGL